MNLVLTVIDRVTCGPIENLRIDVWHADAGGIYSGYAGQGDHHDKSTKGRTYLRGTQMTDATGVVTFNSIYPGWYPGRTPHIHVKGFLARKTVVTGQLFFPDAFSASIYREREPYVARPVGDTTNKTDQIYKTGEKEGGGAVLALGNGNGAILASLNIAVDRSGEAARKAGSWGNSPRRLLGG